MTRPSCGIPSACHTFLPNGGAIASGLANGQVSAAAAHDRIDRRRLHTVFDNQIFALNEATGVVARRDVRESDIVRQRAKERNPGAYQHWNAGDDEPLNEPS